MQLKASKKFMFFILVLMSFLQPLSVQAFDGVKNDSDLCVYATQKYEKQFNIKTHLLTTISNVETGRFDAAKNTTTPWPWTINAEGKGMVFETKQQAIAKVKELQAQGIKSIDVGCMQVNLMYHKNAFNSVDEAFEADKNVAYAAKFLTELYEKNGQSWDKAAMNYHSSEPTKGSRYKKKIDEHFELVKNILPKPIVVAQEVKQKMIITSQNHRKKLDAHAWREAKLEEYRRSKKTNSNI